MGARWTDAMNEQQHNENDNTETNNNETNNHEAMNHDITDNEQMTEHSEAEQESVAKQRLKRIGYEIWDWAKSLLVAIVIVFIIHQYVFYLSTVKGSSMEPTLEDGEWLFVNKAIYYLDQPQRGDIVILKDPRFGKDQFLVKRIIGLPGDIIEIVDRRVYVNGERLDEPYTNVSIEDGDHDSVTIAENHYFVMGDNRHIDGSMDSRYFGSIPSDFIKGRAEFILWPVNKLGGL